MSQLIQTAESGSAETYLDQDELQAIAGLVLAAGFETTVNLLGNGIRMLLDTPEHLDTLRRRPELWPNAVEEILRLDSPVQLTARVALRDVEVAGARIEQGELVVIYLAAANRDPAVFPDPHRFDIERPNAGRHLAFSGGRHFCLGAALARAEGEVGLRTFFDRFPRGAGGRYRKQARHAGAARLVDAAGDPGAGTVDGPGRRLGADPFVSGDAADAGPASFGYRSRPR